MKEVPLTKGKAALVDDEDYLEVSKYKWLLTRGNSKFYAGRDVIIAGRKTRLLLHRELLGAPRGLVVDHKDGDGLNNCRSNIRLATKSQNQQNQRAQARVGKHSRFKGVSYQADSSDRPWKAYIFVGDVKVSLGHFQREERAAQAYNSAAVRYFGEFALLNDVANDDFSSAEDIAESLSRSGAVQRARKKPGCTSKYKGVSQHKDRWRAVITYNSKKRSLGLFSTEASAALAYNKAAYTYFGVHARLNEVTP
jgi:hypothetical protein